MPVPAGKVARAKESSVMCSARVLQRDAQEEATPTPSRRGLAGELHHAGAFAFHLAKVADSPVS